MAVYCSNCGTELQENDRFCGKCGAPVVQAGGAKKSGGSDAEKHKMIGIAVIAVVVLAVAIFALKGIGGIQKRDKADSGEIPTEESEMAEEDDVLAHLRPWMGEWVMNNAVYKNQASGYLRDWDKDEGYYIGDIMSWWNSRGVGAVHINEQYIDFTDLTKDQKNRYPVSSLIYYKTDYGADAFEDPDTEIRFVFYDHIIVGNEDYENVLNIQAYVGMEEPETICITTDDGRQIPVGYTDHRPGPDGWAMDASVSFVKEADPA